MIALYFTAEPETVKHFLKQMEEWEREEKEREKKHDADLRRYVNSLSKAELQERLYQALIDLEESKNRYR